MRGYLFAYYMYLLSLCLTEERKATYTNLLSYDLEFETNAHIDIK